MTKSWFLIVNPTAGNGNFNKLWLEIKHELKIQQIEYSFVLTNYHKHEIDLVHEAINKGYKHIISVGGDGTLHHIINGIMTQNEVESNQITVGIIPLGTGNDWIKTYNISKNIKEAILLIKKENTVYQDIGFLQLKNTSAYFNNVAGIGYDGYVVNKLNKLKRFGPVAYLLSGIAGLIFYKKTTFTIAINNQIVSTKCLMTLFGICKYSGGGMQLTNYKSPNDGLLDVSIVKNLTFLNLLFNLPKLYNGLITKHKKVNTYLSNELLITPQNIEQSIYIQADGELIGTGKVKVTLCKEAIRFVINS
ncbi:diacylglycerol/lipid kinase family protein [Tenacibaculum halocynthiae]|uniref:diacylglycerol/lipid kinase family protein n=1 Tax=Tenacibaculum halocynthiae TaxID=1254437 RepID=UPI0038960B91